MPISKRNRRAVLALIFLVAMVSFLPRLLAGSSHFEDTDISFEELKIAESNLVERQEVWAKKKRKKYKKNSYESRFKKPPSKFDPNVYTQSDWMALGLSEKQAAIVVRLAKRGFNSNADLKRIYVLPEPAFELLKDSTFYPNPLSILSDQRKETPEDKKKYHVSLNSGTEDDFLKVRGIGPYFAKRIVGYREKLGGYTYKEQLLELWKMDLIKYQEIEEFIVLNNEPIRKISINKATSEELSGHPYISFSIANSIVKMREQSGEYTDLKEIKRSKLIDEVTFVKIEPYLTL